jgi:hypothetical protein
MENEQYATPATWLVEAHRDFLRRRRNGDALTSDDWVWLNPNDRVRIQRRNETAAAGVIDVVAPDASIFWVWLDEGRGRVALHSDDAAAHVWFDANT